MGFLVVPMKLLGSPSTPKTTEKNMNYVSSKETLQWCKTMEGYKKCIWRETRLHPTPLNDAKLCCLMLTSFCMLKSPLFFQTPCCCCLVGLTDGWKGKDRPGLWFNRNPSQIRKTEVVFMLLWQCPNTHFATDTLLIVRANKTCSIKSYVVNKI